MKIIFQIDDFIIAKLEKFAHKFQLWTGKNNFWLARIFWGLFCAFVIIKINHVIMLNVLMCLVSLANVISSIEKEKFFIERPNVLNYNKILPFAKWWRVFLLSLTINKEILDLMMFLDNRDIMGLIVEHNLLFFTLAVYFDSLNPLPPGKNKIKELAKAIIKFFKESKVTVPVPEAAG